MKTIQIFVIAFLFSARLLSQDTLIGKNGEIIAGKVMEIGSDQIKYKKSSNPNGPLYVVNKSDIVVIEYQNGSRDVFSSNANNPANNANDVANNNGNNNGNNNSQQDPVYVNQTPAVNVMVGGMPYLGFNLWNWGWGGGWYGGGYGWGRNWGWGRGYNRGYYHGGGRGYGHYGVRGGGGGGHHR